MRVGSADAPEESLGESRDGEGDGEEVVRVGCPGEPADPEEGMAHGRDSGEEFERVSRGASELRIALSLCRRPRH